MGYPHGGIDMKYVYVFLVVVMLVLYFTHPVRPQHFQRAHHQWRVIADVWGIPTIEDGEG